MVSQYVYYNFRLGGQMTQDYTVECTRLGGIRSWYNAAEPQLFYVSGIRHCLLEHT